MKCEICGAKMRFYSHHKGIPINKCTRCGFGRAEVSPDDLKGLYEGRYFEIYYGENESVFGTSLNNEVSRQPSVDGSKKWWIDTFAPGNEISVLEVGPGISAAFHSYLANSRTGVKYEAVEFSSVGCHELNKLGIKTYCGLIYDQEVITQVADRFDYVIATEVIEHDLRPLDFVTGLAKAIRPGGRVCLTTGNFNGLTARVMGARWYYLHPPVHVCFFTPKAAKILFEMAGFKTVRIDCVGLNYYKLSRRVPVPGLLPLVRALQVPTGMTIWAEK